MRPINYKIENISSSIFYIKELDTKIAASTTILISDQFTWNELSQAQTIKDGLNNSELNFYIENILQSVSDAISYLTHPPSTLGEINTASNVGSGVGLFKQKLGVDLEFKSLSSSDFNITGGTNEVSIDTDPAMITNQPTVTPTNGMQALIEDSGTLKKADVSAFLGSGESNTASNVGTGAGVFKQKTGVDLEMRSISSSDFDVTEGADEIEIQADPALITNQSSTTPTAGMQVLLEDSGTLKRGDVSSFLGGGGASFGYDKTKNAYYFAGTNRVDYAYRTNGAVNTNRMNVIGFNIYGQVDLESLSINSNSTLVANLISCIYKYDYATNNWTLVAQSTPYTTGISGFQTYTLPSTVTMENGLYFAGILSDANATNLSGVQANGLFNAFGNTSTSTLSAPDKWFKYTLTYTTTLPATISGYPTGFARQTSGNVAIPLLKFN